MLNDLEAQTAGETAIVQASAARRDSRYPSALTCSSGCRTPPCDAGMTLCCYLCPVSEFRGAGHQRWSARTCQNAGQEYQNQSCFDLTALERSRARGSHRTHRETFEFNGGLSIEIHLAAIEDDGCDSIEEAAEVRSQRRVDATLDYAREETSFPVACPVSTSGVISQSLRVAMMSRTMIASSFSVTMLAFAQATHGGFVRGVNHEVESADTLDCHDFAIQKAVDGFRRPDRLNRWMRNPEIPAIRAGRILRKRLVAHGSGSSYSA